MLKKIIKLFLPAKIRNQLRILQYYYKLGLLWYFFRDKLKPAAIKQTSVITNQKTGPKTRILYIYNIEGWAVCNVGKLWLGGLNDIETTFLCLNTSLGHDKDRLAEIRLEDYDFVWFGYFLLYVEFCKRYRRILDLNKIVVSIHDPMELFPICEDWKSKEMNQCAQDNGPLLRGLKHIVVIDKEFQFKLLEHNIKTHLIPTMSLIPPVEADNLKTVKCDILNVSGVDARKNFELLNSIKEHCKDKEPKVRFREKIGTDYLLPIDTYVRLMDNHEIYICTSFMEGGPLPAMDAMNRGLVVLTTPVGQIQEIIEDGKNGFICRTQEEFIEKIIFLSENLDILQKMRVASREAIREKRNKALIQGKVSALLRRD